MITPFQDGTRRGVLPYGFVASVKAAHQIEDGAAALGVGNAVISLDEQRGFAAV
jgi:hypothetical protein